METMEQKPPISRILMEPGRSNLNIEFRVLLYLEMEIRGILGRMTMIIIVDSQQMLKPLTLLLPTRQKHLVP